MGGIAVVACGVCCAGGILIEYEWKREDGSNPVFFLWLGGSGSMESVAGVFQAALGYPLNSPVSAFRVVQKLPLNVSSKTT